MTEKLQAIQGLTTSIRFQTKGFYQDPQLLVTLVKALDDEDESVRAAAFAALKPIQDSDYDAAMDRSQRRQAMVKWEEWLSKIMAGDPSKTAGR